MNIPIKHHIQQVKYKTYWQYAVFSWIIEILAVGAGLGIAFIQYERGGLSIVCATLFLSNLW